MFAFLQLFLAISLLVVHVRELFSYTCGRLDSCKIDEAANLVNGCGGLTKSLNFRCVLNIRFFRNILNFFVSVTSFIITMIWMIRQSCIPTQGEWQVAVVTLFLTWSHFILLCDKLPIIGTYVVMFTKILWTFLKVSLFGFLLILTFSLVLVALFQDPVILVSFLTNYY